jgi:hypothetical protein
MVLQSTTAVNYEKYCNFILISPPSVMGTFELELMAYYAFSIGGKG